MTHTNAPMIFDIASLGIVRQHRSSAGGKKMLHSGPVYTTIPHQHPVLDARSIHPARLKDMPGCTSPGSNPARAGFKTP